MSDVSILIISNLLMFVGVVIIIAYLVRRDTITQQVIDKRYDNVIQGLIQDVTKNQATYKQEIVSEVRELTLATTNVLVGVERVVSGVEKIVTGVNEVSNNIEKFTDINTKSVTRVAEEVVKVAKEVSKVTCEVERVTKGLKELSTKMSNDIDNGNITINPINGKTNESPINENQ